MASLYSKLQHNPRFEAKVCVTAQHREMLDQVLTFFGIRADYDLSVMRQNQSLGQLTAAILLRLEKVLEEFRPDLICVQGDTTTTAAAGLAAFYAGGMVAHIEAGLRSGDTASPFPEEMNRLIASRIAQFHFAPTESARINLSREGITKNVHVVGNTGIDALQMTLRKVSDYQPQDFPALSNGIDFSKRIILVTGHRRESFGPPFERICAALADIAREDKATQIVYPVHLNPNIKEPAFRLLSGIKNIHLIPPVDYPCLVWLLNRCYFVLTDSGGIQEEAPSFKKPVLVMRDVTERVEALQSGAAKLVGTDRSRIVDAALGLLCDQTKYRAMQALDNPYGDGHAAERIVEILSGL